MREKEKMRKGLLYNPLYDEQLTDERNKCRLLCSKYNKINPCNIEEKDKIIKQILGGTGEKIIIEQPFQCDYGYNIFVGNHFFANYNLTILDPARVTFGDNVFIGPNCSFCTPEHPIDAETRIRGFEYAYEIKVGNNVWIGANAVILGGTVIGGNSVIGAGSVVTKDIPPNVVAAGNPCKIIKEIKNNAQSV